MKIESIIKRDPPTEVVLGDTTYKFQPDSEGRHVVEVTDNAHIARLLSIADGFRIPGDTTTAAAPAPEQAPAPAPAPTAPTLQPTADENELAGSTVHPAIIDLGNGKTVELVDVVAEAHELSSMTTAEWNAMPEEARHQLIDAVLDGMVDEKPDTDADPEAAKAAADAAAALAAANQPDDDKAKHDSERNAAAQAWKDKTGKLPHYKWTIEKINEELAKLPAKGE